MDGQKNGTGPTPGATYVIECRQCGQESRYVGAGADIAWHGAWHTRRNPRHGMTIRLVRGLSP